MCVCECTVYKCVCVCVCALFIVCVCVCVSLCRVARQSVGVRYMVLGLLIPLWHRTRSLSHNLAEERSGAPRRARRLFIDHFWPTWQQEGDEDKGKELWRPRRDKIENRTSNWSKVDPAAPALQRESFLSLKVSLQTFSSSACFSAVTWLADWITARIQRCACVPNKVSVY